MAWTAKKYIAARRGQKIIRLSRQIEELVQILAKLRQRLAEGQEKVTQRNAVISEQNRELHNFRQHAFLPFMGGILQILDVIENKNLTLEEKVRQGLLKLKKFLQANGLTEIPAEVGQEINLDFHEVIKKVLGSKSQDGTIAEVIRKGYLIGDTLIRPAWVKVYVSQKGGKDDK